MPGLHHHQRLGTRLVVLLSIALLPLGALAGLQTYRTYRQADEMTRSAILSRTAEAAAGERALIHRALGAIDALAPIILESGPTDPGCSERLREYVERSLSFVFAGLTSPEGRILCASEGAGRDIAGSPGFQAIRNAGGKTVYTTGRGQVTGLPVMVVAQPLMQADTLVGYLSLSMPATILTIGNSYAGSHLPVDIVTFNARGEVLTANRADGTELIGARTDALLPRDVDLTGLTADREAEFSGVARSGERRQFAVVPIAPDLVFALGSVRLGATDRLSMLAASALMFPVLMWIASIVIVFVAVDRLVISHVRELRGQMRRFALGDRSAPPEVLRNAPAELQEASQTFHNVGRILIRDEQQLAHSVQEKTILLKEIHHRVKNNLQLIASIMNMQIRQVHEPLAKAALTRVQSRVMTLAAVHKQLYQNQTLSAVPARDLLGEVIAQLAGAIRAQAQDPVVSTDIDPVLLSPEEAVPVALFTSEAVANALKYAQSPGPGQRPTISISFKQKDEGAILSVVNSIGTTGPAAQDGQGQSGLGSQLMAAFAAQLGGQIEHGVQDGEYHLQIRMGMNAAIVPPDQ